MSLTHYGLATLYGEINLSQQLGSLCDQTSFMYIRCYHHCLHRQAATWHILWRRMMTSSNGILFRVTDPMCGEFTGRRWITLTNASNAELWCFRSQIARFMGPTWGPPESCRSKMGPMLAPWILLSGLIYGWTNGWANNRDTGALRRHWAHCDIIV